MKRLYRRARPGCLTAAASLGLAACASSLTAPETAPVGDRYTVFDPATGSVDEWEHYLLRKARTHYSMVETPHGRMLQAEGRRSASILMRVFETPLPGRCGRISWRWWVDELQPGADLTSKRRHDVGASIFIAFGDPGIFRDRRVPTLQYVWTNRGAAPDQVIAGPYHEDYLRTVVVRRGAVDDGPVSETRDIVGDYRRAFGAAPETGVHAVALFTDNDDTGEPVSAYYGAIQLHCAAGDA